MGGGGSHKIESGGGSISQHSPKHLLIMITFFTITPFRIHYRDTIANIFLREIKRRDVRIGVGVNLLTLSIFCIHPFYKTIGADRIISIKCLKKQKLHFWIQPLIVIHSGT